MESDYLMSNANTLLILSATCLSLHARLSSWNIMIRAVAGSFSAVAADVFSVANDDTGTGTSCPADRPAAHLPHGARSCSSTMFVIVMPVVSSIAAATAPMAAVVLLVRRLILILFGN